MASMTPQVFYITQGSTAPNITATLIDQNGLVANLTGASVYFRMTNAFLGNRINSAATIVNPTAGQVSYTWQTTDTQNITGTFSCQWYVVYSSGAQESYPQGFYNTVQIDPALSSTLLGGVALTPLFNTIWSLSRDPGSVDGNNGDFWYNTTSGYFFGPKAGGTWPTGHLINISVAPLNTFAVPTGNVAMGGFSFNNLGATVIAPIPTTVVPLTLNSSSGTTADVLDVSINNVKQWWVSSAGTLNGIGKLNVAPTATGTTALVANAPSGTTVDLADFQINNVTAWSIGNTGTLTGTQPVVVAPTATGAIPFTATTPASSTADVADFTQNGTTVLKVNSSGNTAITGGKQIDLTAAASSPFIGNASTTYTTTWSSASSPQPAIGNGTLLAKYIKTGRLVTLWIEVYPGSTTTFGTGVYSWTLPFPTAAAPYNIGNFLLLVGSQYMGQCYTSTSTLVTCIYQPTGSALNAPTPVVGVAGNTANPIAWTTTTTFFTLQLTYEATS